MNTPPNTLSDMLTYKRPHGSATEEAFIKKFIKPLRDHPNVTAFIQDEIGNISINVLTLDGNLSETLFTAHTDTVHFTEGIQTVLTTKAGVISALDSDCLGADDGAGIWLLINMIHSGVPGTYLFTRGEERGGIGSRYLAETQQEFLGKYKRAIAFDRKGIDSVITHQASTRCCSDIFAGTLAMKLNKVIHKDYAFMSLDDTGIYTDTAEFIEFIPECTNLSVGYYSEHTSWETLDSVFLQKLLEALIQIDFESLPTVRDPAEMNLTYFDDPYYDQWNRTYYNWGYSDKYL